MIVYVPIRLYRVNYQIAAGRPFSRFDQLILAAIRLGHQSVNALAELFQVPSRLVVESLYTLAHAGWLTVDPRGQLGCSQQESENDSAQIPADLHLVNESTELVQERVTGQLIRKDAVSYVPLERLKKQIPQWKDGVEIPAGALSPQLEPGQCRPYLRNQLRDEGGYIRWVDRGIEIVRAQIDVLVATVDLSRPDDPVSGLPRSWLPALSDILLAHAQRRTTELLQGRNRLPPADWVAPYLAVKSVDRVNQIIGKQPSVEPAMSESWHVPKAAVAWLSGSRAHIDVFGRLLQAPVPGYMFLVTPTLRLPGVQALWPYLEEALARRWEIDLLWGSEPSLFSELESHRNALELLKKLAYDSSRQLGERRMRIGPRPCGVRSSVLLTNRREQHTDPNQDTWRAIVGAFEWMGVQQTGRICSVELTEHLPVARLCRIAYDFACSVSDSQIAMGSASRLDDAAGSIEENAGQARGHEAAPLEKDQVSVRLWLDRQHQAALASWADQSRLRIGTRNLEADVIERDLGLLSRAVDGLPITVVYSKHDLSPDSAFRQDLRVELHEDKTLRMSFLAAPNRLLVTSHDWLAAYPPAVRPYAMDIGIDVEGMELPKDLPWD